MKITKGEIFYYFYRYKDDIIYAKLEAVRDYEGPHGLASSFKVLYSNSDFHKGAIISANQLSGISVRGVRHYLSKSEKQTIMRIFGAEE